MTVERPLYREVPPSPPLAPYVQCYWTITATAAPPVPNRVCPDGAADIILDFAARVPAAGRADGRRTYAVGTMRRATVVPLAGPVDLLGVRFRPGAAAAFFGLPMHELTDRSAPLADVWPDAGAFEPCVAEAASLAVRIARLERALLDRLRRAPEPATLVRQAVGFIDRTGGTRPVRQLEDAVGVGGRQLERRFREAAGVSPKLFARVVRFQRALALVQGPTRPEWARLAVAAGYYDQAHFIRDFKTLAGVTPTAYAAEWPAVGVVQYRDACSPGARSGSSNTERPRERRLSDGR